jgi:Uma2 family endonuclease
MTTQIKQPRRLFNVDEYYAMAKAGILGEGGYELIQGVVYAKGVGKPRVFSVSDYYAMAEAGILTEDERVELINGEIIEMSRIGSRHASAIYSLEYLVPGQLGGRAIAGAQNPLRLHGDVEVQPDFMILKLRDDFYASAHPGPEDVLLLIEVSDTTLDSDRNEKLPLYANAGIPETWIANIPERVVEVYTNPVNGVYTNRQVFSVGESVSPSAFPDISLPVSRIVPG